MIDVQQGQPRGRPDGRARAGHVEQRGGQAEVGTGLLQLPGELPEPDAVDLGAGQHSDRLRAAAPYHVRRVIEIADDRHARHLGSEGLSGQACGHYLEAVVALPAQLGDQVRDRGLVPHGHHRGHRPARVPLPVQSLAELVPGDQVQHRDGEHADQQVKTRQLVVGHVGEQGEPGREAPGCVQHLPELVRAGPDEPRVVAAEDRERDHPRDRQQAAQQQVLDGRVRTEAKQRGPGRGYRRDHEVSGSRPAPVTTGPRGRSAREALGEVITRDRNRIRHTYPAYPSRRHNAAGNSCHFRHSSSSCMSDAQPGRLVYSDVLTWLPISVNDSWTGSIYKSRYSCNVSSDPRALQRTLGQGTPKVLHIVTQRSSIAAVR